jgi:hypothetical protein
METAAKADFVPWIVNRSAGYPFQDFNWGVPFAAYDMEAVPPRRLAVGQLENNTSGGLVDGRYWPPPSSSNAVLNVDSYGPKEWFIVFDRTYSLIPDADLQVDIFNTQTPMMWFGTPTRTGSFHGEDRFRIEITRIPPAGNMWAFDPVDLAGGPDGTIPEALTLFPNYPNPFNAGTTIKYGLPAESRVMLRIYNILGQEVRRLVDETQLEGYRTAKWDGRNNVGVPVASGVYLYRLQATTLEASAREFTSAQKMIIIR